MKSPATNTSLRTIGGDAVPFVAWFGPEKSRAVVWIVAATCFPLLSLRAQPTAATFRQLISSPPIIEEIVAERRYEGTKPTDFYFGRWQTNAFLLSVLTNLPNIERGGGAGDLTDVRAYFDDQAWTVFGANRPLKIGSLNTISPSNELVVALHWASFDLGRLLNAGIEHLKPRQVIWTSDLTFIGTNDANPIVVSGTLKTNSSGGVIGANMEIMVWPRTGSSSDVEPRKHQWEFVYEYDASISDVFPAVIKRFVVQPKRFLRDEIRLHRIKLSAQPMAKEAFAYEPFVNTNSWVLHGTNDGFFYIDRQGAKQPLLLGNPAEDGSRRVIIPILFIGAMLVIPVILFKLVKRK